MTNNNFPIDDIIRSRRTSMLVDKSREVPRDLIN